MNERIKKIAKDACVLGDWGEDVSEGRFFITGNTKQMEKFAELIVRECINEIGYKSVDLLDIDFYPHYQERLKKHFGVLE